MNLFSTLVLVADRAATEAVVGNVSRWAERKLEDLVVELDELLRDLVRHREDARRYAYAVPGAARTGADLLSLLAVGGEGTPAPLGPLLTAWRWRLEVFRLVLLPLRLVGRGEVFGLQVAWDPKDPRDYHLDDRLPAKTKEAFLRDFEASRGPPSSCWTWRGRVCGGVPVVRRSVDGKKVEVSARRLAWEFGSRQHQALWLMRSCPWWAHVSALTLPDERVHEMCGSTLCVNPEHLHMSSRRIRRQLEDLEAWKRDPSTGEQLRKRHERRLRLLEKRRDWRERLVDGLLSADPPADLYEALAAGEPEVDG